MTRAKCLQRGFTLVELVVSITVSTIVVGFMALFLVTPVSAYLAQGRRADLVESANNAARMLADDIRAALPDSVRSLRNGSIVAIQMLHVVDVARYRDAGSSGVQALDLDIPSASDTQFSILGHLQNVSPPSFGGYLVIGHGVNGGDAYSPTGVIATAQSISSIGPDETSITLNSPFTNTQSPTQSLFFVSGPVTYICNEGTHTLTKFWNHLIRPALSAQDDEAKLLGDGASSAVVARDVRSCEVGYSLGTAQHGGLATLRLEISRDLEVPPDRETLQVMMQVPVENVP